MPRRLLRRHLRDVDASHVLDEGWGGTRNGALLRLMLGAGFGILVTVDRNLEYQQNVAAGIAVIVLHAHSNRTEDLAPLVPALRAALPGVQPAWSCTSVYDRGRADGWRDRIAEWRTGVERRRESIPEWRAGSEA